eukprot:GHVP01002941.1.p1 GENE.GHVP01002941.1~~GHVP01002941.1.p1  ORF type:complete len:267 (+),score=38.35 GHVP01002941.1:960-1760(+)
MSSDKKNREPYTGAQDEGENPFRNKKPRVSSFMGAWLYDVIDICLGAIFLIPFPKDSSFMRGFGRISEGNLGKVGMIAIPLLVFLLFAFLINFLRFNSIILNILMGTLHCTSKWFFVRILLVKATFYETGKSPGTLPKAALIFCVGFIICGIFEKVIEYDLLRATLQSIILTISVVCFSLLGYYKNFMVFTTWEEGKIPVPLDKDFVIVSMLIWFTILTPIAGLLIRKGVINKERNAIKGSLYLSNPVSTILLTLVKMGFKSSGCL